MKKNYLFIITLLINYCIGYSQNFGQLASGIKINNTIYNTTGDASHNINPSIGAQDFDGANLGTFGANSICANVTGGEIKTNKIASANVCSATIFWSVYPSGSPSGIFTPISLATVSDCNSGTSIYYDGIGICADGDQKWKDYNLNIDFATGLAPGNYILEIYYSYTGSNISTSTCETTEYISNGGANYKAAFTISNPITSPVASTMLLCEGNTLTLTANPGGGIAPYTYSWTGPSGFSSTDENPVINNVTTSNSGTYSLIVTDACGAVSTTQSTAAVVVNIQPVAGTDGSTTVCDSSGATIDLFSLISGEQTGGTWTRTSGTGGTFDASAGTFSPTSGAISSTFTYTIIGTAPCVNVESVATININPSIVPSVSILASPVSPICAGTSVTFTATPINGGSTPIFQWYMAGTPVGTNSSSFTTNALVNGNLVKVEMTSNVTCPVPTTVTSNILTMTVNPVLTPSVTIEATETIFCDGTSVTFSVDGVVTNGGLTPTYQWRLNGTAVGTNINSFTSSSLSNNDVVTLDVTSSAVCATPAMVTSNSIQVSVNPNLPASVSIDSSDSDNIICSGTNVTFTATPTNGGTTPTYQWYIGVTPVGSNSTTYSTSGLTTGQSVSVVMTSNAICATGSPANSNTIITTVNPNLPASVSIVSSDVDNTICAGTSVTFSAIPANGGTAPIYQWYEGTTPVGSSSTTYITSGLTTGQSVSVVLTSNALCAIGSPATSNTIITTVNPNLPASVNIVSDDADDIICAGTSVTFTATPTNGGSTPTYQWYEGTTLVGTNSAAYTTSGLTTGQSVSVVMTSNALCATGSPVTSNTIATTVNPNLPVSVSIAATATTICAGTSVTFTATPINGGVSPSFQWQVNGVNTGTNSDSFTTSSLTNSQIVTVIVTSNATPCATGNPATSNSIAMTVHPNLPVSVSVSASATTICAGNSVTFTAIPTNEGAAPAYQWQVDGMNAGTNSNIFTTSGLTNGQVVTVILTSNITPCAISNPATSSGITMNVNPNLPVSVSVSASATTICPGTSVTFTATPTNGGTTPTYQWKINGVNAGTNSNTFTTTTLTNGQIVTVVLTSNATCATSSPATSTGITMTVNLNLSVSVSIASTATTICAGTSVTFKATPTNGGATPSYQWKINGVNTGTNSNTFTTSTLTNGQIVTVLLTSNATPCATGNPATSNSISMTVNPLVTPSVSITSTSTSICQTTGTSVTFTATPTNGGTTPTYQWQRNGTNIAGATSSTYTTTSLANPSTITVVMTSNAICPSPAIITSNGIVMNVYPNDPSNWTGNPLTLPLSVCPPAIINISATAVTNAQYYTWNLPAGFTITSGAGTNNITVSVGIGATIGNNQNVTVQAFNPCGNNVSKTDKINVNTFNGVTVNQNSQNVCSNGSIAVIGTLTGNAASGTWSAPSGSFSNIITSGTNPITVSATYTPSISSGNATLTITTNAPSGGGCPNVPGTATVNVIVNEVVTITSQPAATQTACSGTNASFSLTATGTGLTYQWRKGTTNLVNGGNISGANTATLSLTGILTTDAGSYNVVVSGASPCAAVTSNPAVLAVNQVGAITTQPAISLTVCSGNSASFSTTATGTGLTYQWRKGTTNLSNGGNISGATTNTLTINPAESSDAAADYNVVITGTAPCTAVTSNNAALVVNDAVAITSQPAATQTACSGTNVSFSVTATGTGLIYQWRKGTTNLVNGSNISGATSATLTLTGVLTTDAGSYNVVVSGVSPCAAVTSSNAVLVVNQIVAISAHPAVTQTVCSGNSASFSTTATGTGLTYQWRKGTTNLYNGGNISGATINTLTINPAASSDAAADYNVVITGTAPCTAGTSNNAALVVNDAVAITSQPAATQTVCSGTNANFSVTATGTGLTYQWRKGTTNLYNIGNISGATSATLSLTGILTTDAGSYNVVVSGASPCAAVTSSNAVLVVNQLVAISAQPTISQTVCSGNSASFSTTATGTGLTHQWRKGTTNLSNGGNISGATTNTLTINPVVSADAASDYNVVITGTVPCTAVTSNNAALVVNDAVAITSQPAATQTACSGTNASFSVTATGTGLTYQWRKGTTNLSNIGNISGATSATLSLTGILTTDAGSYNVVVSGASPCAAVTSSNAVLVVNQIVAIIAQPAVTQTVCSGNSTSLSVTATGTGLSYQWRKGTTNLSNNGNISGATTNTLTINPVVSADAASDYNAVITGTVPCTAVTSNNAALVVNDAVAITSQPAATQTVCSGTNASFSVTATETGLTYQWRKGTTNLSNIGNISGATSATLTISNVASADAANNYNVLITGTSPCTPMTSNNAILLVNKTVVIGTQPSNVGICASSPAQFGVVASGDGLTYQWYKGTFPGTAVTNTAFISGAQTNILKFSQAFLPDDGVYYVVVSGASPCASVKSNEVTLNVDQSIIFTTQPVSQSLCIGSNVTFSVVANANGDPLTFQWRKNGANTGGLITSTSTSSSFTINNITAGDAANYSVVISGPVGYTCSSVTSTAATLTVNPLPTAIAGGTQTICSNSTATVSGATSSNGTISWSENGAGSITADGTTLAPTYTAALGDAGNTVTLTMTVTSINACTPQTATAIYSIIVNPLPTASAGGTQTICSNSTATVSGTTSSNGTISWSENGAGSITAGRTTLAPTYTAAPGDAGNTVTLTMTVTSTNVCTPAITATTTYTVIVNPLPTASAGGAQTICSNATATVSGATSSNGTISWSENGAGSITAGGTTLAPTYTAALGDAGNTVTLTMTVTSTIACTPAITAMATYTIIVNPLPTASAGGSQTICSNSSATVSGATSSNGTISWSENGAGSITAGGTTMTPTYTAAPSDAGNTVTLTMTVTSINACAQQTATATYLIIVNPLPTASAGGSQTICSNATATVSGAASSNGTISWSENGAGSITAGNTTLTPTYTAAAGDAGNIVTLTMTVTGTIACTAPITRTATYTINVNPLPTATAGGSQTICSNSTATVSGATSSNGTISWSENGAGSITSNGTTLTPTYTAAAGDSGNIVTLTMTVTSTIACTTPITRSATYTINVNPLPTATAGGSQTICSNAAATVSGATSSNGTISWSENGAGSITSNGTTLTPTYTAAAGDAGNTVTLTMTVTSTNACAPQTATATYSITIDPISIGGNLAGYATDQAGNPHNNPIVYSKNLIACLSTDGLLVLNGYTGNIIRWEYSTDAGINWNALSNTTNSYAYSDIPQTRIYRAVIQSGSCGIAYSNIVTISVIPQDIKPAPVTASKTTMCLGETTVFNATSGFATGQTITGGDFDQGQLNTQDPDGWLVNGSPSGWTANGNTTKPSLDWSGTNGPKTFGGITYDTSDNSKFGIVYGIVTSVLETPIFNTFGLTNAKLEFNQAYFLGAGSNIKVELSINGGITYPISLQNITGSISSGGFIGLNYTSFDLSDYVGQSQLRIRFTFAGVTSNSTWALENFKLPTPPAGPDIVWTDENGLVIGNSTTHSETPVSPGVYNFAVTSFLNGCVYTITPSNTVFIPVNVNLAYAGKDVAILPFDCGNNSVKLNAYDNRETADKNIADGAFDNNYQPGTHPGTQATGKWTIKSTSTCGTGSFLPNDTDPEATFTGESGTYVLTWTTGGCSDDVQIIFTDCKSINFDGLNDSITFKDNYDLTNSFSIEIWVKPNSVTGTQTIFSKRDSNNLATGYDLKLTGSIVSFNWNASGTIASTYPINTSRWYHISVTYNGTIYRLYLDGIEVSNSSGIAGIKPIENAFDCIVGAMDQTGSPPNKPVKYFNGWVDELRIWNLALSPEQLHQMMNQEIKTSPTVAGNVQGAIVPIDINGLSWTTNLLGYYQMSNISCGYLNPTKGTALGKLRNITTIEDQTAPIPYISANNGDWKTMSTWVQPLVWDYPNSTGYNGTPIDWNIVRTRHNIISNTENIKLLGLLVDDNKLTITGAGTQDENNSGTGLFISHYLLLNGNIDLVGESQLIEQRFTPTQFSESILDPTSTGFIKRDQQGQKNSFNYNYWASPVSTIQGSLNNVPYTINNILRDGTNSTTPININFGSTIDFADALNVGPIKITDRWIWSYNSSIVDGDDWGNYYKWYNVKSSGALKVGEGFTMKGSGGSAPITATQNYTFIGKPNSGTIILNLIKDNSYLVGNPYPSALDADEFIKDNIKETINGKVGRNTKNIFSGALYFWDHFGLSNNHYLAEYQGGYATYSLAGGVVAINNDPLNLNNGAPGSNIPKQFIPVGQAFFIDGYLDTAIGQVATTVEGGDLVFKNSQRAFSRENNVSSMFMKKRGTTKAVGDNRPKIRLGYDSSIGAHRQLLITSDTNTTNQFDVGYDAPMYDTNENDMFWEISDSQFVIQAVPDFKTDRVIPLGIVVTNEGEVTIKIDELENVSSNTKIYLHDNATGMHHDLKNSDFKTSLAIGEYNKRFSLKFESKTLDLVENDSNNNIVVLYSRNYKTLIIKNNDLDATVNTVSLFNMLGQAISNWDVEDKEQTIIQIPIKNIPSGIYIVKVKTSIGESSKKIIIN